MVKTNVSYNDDDASDDASHDAIIPILTRRPVIWRVFSIIADLFDSMSAEVGRIPDVQEAAVPGPKEPAVVDPDLVK